MFLPSHCKKHQEFRWSLRKQIYFWTRSIANTWLSTRAELMVSVKLRHRLFGIYGSWYIAYIAVYSWLKRPLPRCYAFPIFFFFLFKPKIRVIARFIMPNLTGVSWKYGNLKLTISAKICVPGDKRLLWSMHFMSKQKISRFEITGFHESAMVFPNLRVFTKCGKINWSMKVGFCWYCVASGVQVVNCNSSRQNSDDGFLVNLVKLTDKVFVFNKK